MLERSRKTKTKVITLFQSQQMETTQRANQNWKQIHETGAKRGKTRAARQNTIGLGLDSHWLRKLREFC